MTLDSPLVLLIDMAAPYRDAIHEWCRVRGMDAPQSIASAPGALAERSGLLLVQVDATQPSTLDRVASLCKVAGDAPVVVLADGAGAEFGFQLSRLGVASAIDVPAPAHEVAARAFRFLRHLPTSEHAAGLIGQSRGMRSLLEDLRQAAGTSLPILIDGETGTGKTLLAEWIHEISRRNAPFVEVDCGTLSGDLMRTELFGHEKGAFTDAKTQRTGKFEQARNGTILIDEIGDLDLDLQRNLLRVLQSGVFERVGGTQPLKSRARVIAATHSDLRELVRQGRFREDLLYRLRVLAFTVPPLRDRIDDLPLLVESFVERFCQSNGLREPARSASFLDALAQHPWRGNVRELLHVLERCLVLRRGDLTAESLEGILTPSAPSPSAPGGVRHQDPQRQAILAALSRTGGNLHATARLLGVTVQAVRWQLAKHPELAEHRERLRA